MDGSIDGVNRHVSEVLRISDEVLDGRFCAVYSAPAGRAALNDLRGWPFPCPEAM
jgi:hypothetical protein